MKTRQILVGHNGNVCGLVTTQTAHAIWPIRTDHTFITADKTAGAIIAASQLTRSRRRYKHNR